MNPTFCSMTGNSDDVMVAIAQLYLTPGDRVADVTYGKGVFWRKIDTKVYKFFASDLLTGSLRGPVKRHNFTDLPHKANSFDCVVFDPPYMHNPGKTIVDANYQNKRTSSSMYHADIMDRFYRRGMSEGARILKSGGILVVKCSDELESGCQCRGHVEVFDIATRELDLVDLDMFIITGSRIVQVKKQLHARKNYSFFWVFQKFRPSAPRPNRRRYLTP